ncbi:non-structural maintenance of chromosomes element 4 homolog A [Melitaea cinxia]|uniref:non-structural maintenance of chromosomes element 4 homolog A n=1 Tax=Melitaea cinxia TaxID=113334 RepID=UPI001E274A92|nr:non-structural maintenance of chromosomes element 4 homolog A [Melitaea cinxia]
MSAMELDVNNLSDNFYSTERKKFLQTLYKDTSHIGHKSSNPPEMIQETKNVLTQANNLFKDGKIEDRVQNPAENYLDSQVIKATSEAAIQCSQAISSELNKYDKTELAENIKRNSDFWCFAFPNEAPPVTYLHGASNDAPRPRAPRAPRARAQLHQQAVPRTGSIVTDNDEDTKKAQIMFKKLESVCKDNAMNYFKAVLDPNNFSRTVENIYHLSFMVRDGKLAVFVDDDTGLPLIQTLNNKKRRRLENTSETQFIVSIDMKRWKELVEVFRITEPFFE